MFTAFRALFALLTVWLLTSCAAQRSLPVTGQWAEVPLATTPVARHEAAFIQVGERYYLLGGRGIRPVSIFDPVSKLWTQGNPPPVEIHHFQPVIYNDEIYLLGAMTGGYPGETPLPNVYVYNPARDEWRTGHEIPAERRRGGAGVAIHDGLIYLVCGIRDGHRGDHKRWLDTYNPATGRVESAARCPPRPRSFSGGRNRR